MLISAQAQAEEVQAQAPEAKAAPQAAETAEAEAQADPQAAAAPEGKIDWAAPWRFSHEAVGSGVMGCSWSSWAVHGHPCLVASNLVGPRKCDMCQS